MFLHILFFVVVISKIFKKFLKKIVRIKPIQNSRLASDIKKKDDDIKIKSSFTLPFIITRTYKMIHINSEYKTRFSILLQFVKKKIIKNQNKKEKKLMELYNKKFN